MVRQWYRDGPVSLLWQCSDGSVLRRGVLLSRKGLTTSTTWEMRAELTIDGCWGDDAVMVQRWCGDGAVVRQGPDASLF